MKNYDNNAALIINYLKVMFENGCSAQIRNSKEPFKPTCLRQ